MVVKGPTSALTSFLEEKGIRARNPRPYDLGSSEVGTSSQHEAEEQEQTSIRIVQNNRRRLSQLKKEQKDMLEANKRIKKCVKCDTDLEHGSWSIYCTPCRKNEKKEYDENQEKLDVFRSQGSKKKAKKVKFQKLPHELTLMDEYSTGKVPTLLSLCMKYVSENIDFVEGFGDLDINLYNGLCKIICKLRKLTDKTFLMFLNPRRLNLGFYDCSEVTEDALSLIPAVCPNVTELTLKQCGRLTDDSLMTFFMNFQNLQELTLTGCFLIDDVGIANIKNLRKLHLENIPRLTDLGLSKIVQRNPDLTSFTLRYSTGVRRFDILTDLEQLRFLDTRNSFPDLKIAQFHLEKLPNLLNLYVDHLNDECLLKIQNCLPNLTELSLCENQLISTHGFKDFIREMKYIKKLDLSYCLQIDDDAISALYNSQCIDVMEDLNIGGLNSLSSSTLACLFNRLRSIRSINVSWCYQLTDESLDLLMKKAKYIYVWGCNRLTEASIKPVWNSIIYRNEAPNVNHDDGLTYVIGSSSETKYLINLANETQ